MTIHKSLLNIQQGLNAPKDNYNKYGKYNYRSLEGILTALKPLNDIIESIMEKPGVVISNLNEEII